MHEKNVLDIIRAVRDCESLSSTKLVLTGVRNTAISTMSCEHNHNKLHYVMYAT